jgi:hypothetical protein
MRADRAQSSSAVPNRSLSRQQVLPGSIKARNMTSIDTEGGPTCSTAVGAAVAEPRHQHGRMTPPEAIELSSLRAVYGARRRSRTPTRAGPWRELPSCASHRCWGCQRSAATWCRECGFWTCWMRCCCGCVVPRRPWLWEDSGPRYWRWEPLPALRPTDKSFTDWHTVTAEEREVRRVMWFHRYRSSHARVREVSQLLQRLDVPERISDMDLCQGSEAVRWLLEAMENELRLRSHENLLQWHAAHDQEGGVGEPESRQAAASHPAGPPTERGEPCSGSVESVKSSDSEESAAARAAAEPRHKAGRP